MKMDRVKKRVIIVVLFSSMMMLLSVRLWLWNIDSGMSGLMV